MNTINSGGLRMRLNVSSRVPTKMATFFLTVGSTGFALKVEVKDDFGWHIF
jgi:hypothetical protein